jgi:glucosamine--fructose-6-phosphate aminotransferase (isomerizing)
MGLLAYSEAAIKERAVPSNVDVIQGRYFADLMNQPEALRATWDALHETTDALERIGRECGRERFERVVLTGMGGSFFGLHPLAVELAASGWTPMMVETSELIHYYPELLRDSTLVIAVSQSGKSAETVRLLEMNAKRAKVIGVTNWADSPLAREADLAVMTTAGDEYTVSCKTYVTAQMALRVLGAVLNGRDAGARLQEMEPAAEAFREYLSGWKRHVDESIEMLQGARDVFLVGRGESMAAAQTGALTIKESTHFHAEGMSSAAFRHGPFEMLKEGIFIGVFAGDAKTRELNERLVKDVAGTSARAVLFADDAKGVFRLPKVAKALRTVVEILPVQMMTLALAALAGREAGKFERATKVTSVE